MCLMTFLQSCNVYLHGVELLAWFCSHRIVNVATVRHKSRVVLYLNTNVMLALEDVHAYYRTDCHQAKHR